MSHDYIQRRVLAFPVAEGALVTNLVNFAGSTGVVAIMNFATAVEVLSMGIVVDGATTWTPGTLSIALQKYLVPSINTNAVTLGTITPGATGAVGTVYRNRLQSISGTSSTGSDGSTVTVAPRLQPDWQATQLNNFIVKEGQQLVWNLTVAATSGKGQVYVEYVERPLTKYDGGASYVEIAS